MNHSKSPLRARVIFSGVLILCGIVAALIFFQGDPADAIYGGRPLSQHLIIAFGSRTETPLKAPATFAEIDYSRKAVLTAGTNCAPLLRKWLECETRPWKVEAGLLLSKLNLSNADLPPDELRVIALRALTALKGDGLPAAAQLAASCTNSNSMIAGLSLDALISCFMRLEKVPPPLDPLVIAALDNTLSVYEDRALHDLSYRHQLVKLREVRHVAGLLPGIESKDINAEAKTLRVFSRRNEAFNVLYPRLVTHLRSPDAFIAENAVICLKNYGPCASNALPILKEALIHPEERVRRATTNAIRRISGTPAPG